MSKQFNTYRVGIESMTETQLAWWEKKGVTYKPILEYNPLSKEETSRLKTEYYDNNNRVGFEKLYAAVRKPAGKSNTGKPKYSPTLRQVQAWLAQQEVAQDYKPIQHPKESRPILVSKVNDLIQMDYVVLTEDLTFGKHRYILNAIDVLSKKAYTRSPPTTSSTGATAAQTLVLAKQIFDEIKAEHGSYPKRLQTDNGAHFLSVFDKAFKPGGSLAAIKYSSGMRYRATSQSVVERFNRTLRDMIRRYVASGSKDWPRHLQQFVGNYNKNRHSTTRLAPNEAAKADVGDAHTGPKTKNQQLLQASKDRIKEKAKLRNKNLMLLSKGDKVRLMNFKKAKGSGIDKDEPNWWPEVYEIYHVFQSKVGRAPQYALEPNPPTTIVGNRPGYQGAGARGRRKFSVYELQVIGRIGEKASESIAVSRSVSTLGKVSPENAQKAGKPAKASAPATQPASTKVHGVTAKELVGKTIRVEFGDDGERFDGKVQSYKSGYHRVYYEADGETVSSNFFFPKNKRYVSPNSWKIV